MDISFIEVDIIVFRVLSRNFGKLGIVWIFFKEVKRYRGVFNGIENMFDYVKRNIINIVNFIFNLYVVFFFFLKMVYMDMYVCFFIKFLL